MEIVSHPDLIYKDFDDCVNKIVNVLVSNEKKIASSFKRTVERIFC